MNTKIALAVIAVLISSQSAMASRQGGTNNQTRSGKANATSGSVVRGSKAVQAKAAAASTGTSSSDAAASAAANAFAKKKAQSTTAAAPAARTERPRISNGAKSADTSGQSPEAKFSAAIKGAKLDGKLNGRLPELSAVLAKDSALAGVASEILKTNASKPQLVELNSARIEGLLNVSKLSSEVRDLSKDLVAPGEVAQQAYVALVQNAGREAAGWPETTQKNMVELLTKANDKIAGGMSVAEAIESARIEMLTISKVKIDLDQIKKLCGKV